MNITSETDFNESKSQFTNNTLTAEIKPILET